jgi:hypothetical protein
VNAKKPYETYDYRLNDMLVGEAELEDNQVLDENGAARPAGGSPAGLAAIAAALHRHGNAMTPEHLEKAVWWLKDWTMHRSGWYRKVSGMTDYYQATQAIKETEIFKAFGKRGRRLTLYSHISAVVSTLLTLLVALTWSETGWGWHTAGIIGALFLAGVASSFTDSARQQWQTQDRVYFLTCLRKAECTDDLLDAGLFAHDEDTMQLKDNLRSRRAVRRLQRQLGQALYFDFDHNIRENFLFEAPEKS